MIYKVQKKDQYDQFKYFMFSFSAPDSRLPYQIIISSDFESLKYVSLNTLLSIARKLEIDYSNLNKEEVIEKIKQDIEFE